MYNILNPVHYIAANNPTGTIEILLKYGLPAPVNDAEMATATTYAAEQIGEPFLRDIAHLHPDKNYLISMYNVYQTRGNYKFSSFIEGPYKELVSGYSVDQLNSAIQSLSAGVSAPTEADQEKILFLKQLLAEKSNTASTKNTSGNADDIAKRNHNLLVVVAVIALMFVGAKVFNKN